MAEEITVASAFFTNKRLAVVCMSLLHDMHSVSRSYQKRYAGCNEDARLSPSAPRLQDMGVRPFFRDRTEAGRALAAKVAELVPGENPLVLALPRGGVPVAYEVAKQLRAELDVFLVRKLGLPGQEELAIGAIGSGGVRVLNEDLLNEVQLSGKLIEQITDREKQELERREDLYRQGRAALTVADRTVILVDDGLATGASMRAALQALRRQRPKRIVVAVPVAAPETCLELREHAEQILTLHTPSPLLAIGIWYEDFSQATDREVQRLLREAEKWRAV